MHPILYRHIRRASLVRVILKEAFLVANRADPQKHTLLTYVLPDGRERYELKEKTEEG